MKQSLDVTRALSAHPWFVRRRVLKRLYGIMRAK
jgi:hypothetical protein